MPEITAFFLTAVLYVYHLCEKDLYRARQQRLLGSIMVVSLLSSGLNIISCTFIITGASFSYFLIHLVHGTCFLLSILQSSLLLWYVADMIYTLSPNAYRAVYIHNATKVMLALNAAALIINIPTGIIFTVSPVTCEYIRGPVSFFTPLTVLIQIIMSMTVVLLERRYHTPEFARLSVMFPPIVAILLLIQLFSRDLQMGGLIGFTVLLFIVFDLSTNHLLEDEVTGFPGRACFENTLREFFLRDRTFAVVRLTIPTLDGLRRTFGKKETDNVVRAISRRLMALRGLKHVFSGAENEFMLIAPGMESRECERFASELVSIFETDWYLGESVIRLDTDILMISCPVVAEDYDTLMSLLDYTSRNPNVCHDAGDSNVSLSVCDVKTKSLIRREQYVLGILRQACAKNGFEYYYQPIYRVSGEFSGMAECLLRLRDEENGAFISPYEFIPIAEKYGLIGLIGSYVLEASCALVRRFIDAGKTPPVLSVNFSARQFYDVTLPKNVMSCISRHGIPSSCIKIEITESYLISNYEQVRMMMDELVAQGVGFFLDDFGSGFSNIPRYINLPFECIKYDHSLLKSSETNEKTDRLLRALTPSFISFGYRIVFEGVEKEDNLSYVSSFGDVYVQGYYFSYAVPERRFCSMLGLEE